MTRARETDCPRAWRGEALEAIAGRTSKWLEASAEGALDDAGCRMHALALSFLCAQLAPEAGIGAVRSKLARAAQKADLDLVDPITSFFARAAAEPGGAQPEGIFAWEAGRRGDRMGAIDQSAFIALFSTGPEGHSGAVALVESVAAHGAFDLAPHPLCADLLAGAALGAARSGDLLLAARSVRAAGYLQAPSKHLRESFSRFFETIQQVDGSFVSATQLCEASRACPRLTFILKAVTSVHALWSLAELRAPEFRLMRVAQAPAPGGGAPPRASERGLRPNLD